MLCWPLFLFCHLHLDIVLLLDYSSGNCLSWNIPEGRVVFLFLARHNSGTFRHYRKHKCLHAYHLRRMYAFFVNARKPQTLMRRSLNCQKYEHCEIWDLHSSDVLFVYYELLNIVPFVRFIRPLYFCHPFESSVYSVCIILVFHLVLLPFLTANIYICA